VTGRLTPAARLKPTLSPALPLHCSPPVRAGVGLRRGRTPVRPRGRQAPRSPRLVARPCAIKPGRGQEGAVLRILRLEDGVTDSPHPEGRFFPDTYMVSRNTADTVLLRQASDLLAAKLKVAWDGRQPGLPLDDPYELLILASLVEREAALDSERAQIAGVFIRRLQSGMRLQTDPSVIYGLGPGFDGNLTRKHLETDTPYNTYTRDGLPPTPIGLPGEASLLAAAHPEPGNELYFVASGQGDGAHIFSATLAEHNAAVASYIREQRKLVARQRAEAASEQPDNEAGDK